VGGVAGSLVQKGLILGAAFSSGAGSESKA
jgi:hypothetical protein